MVEVESVVEAEFEAVVDVSSVVMIDGASIMTVRVDVDVRPFWSMAT